MKKLSFSIVALILTFGAFKTPLWPIIKYRLAPNYPTNESKKLKIKNLIAPTTVVFDAYGLPHIEAQNLADLVRATGFVQARYRGFQLDLLRHFAAGRLSELLGEQKALDSTTVEFDLAMRGWGFEKRSKVDTTKLPKRDRLILEAFTDGVNQGMALYPTIEHEILGVKPRPWRPQDTLLVGLLQAWSITHNWEQEALRFSLALELGSELAQKVYPFEPAGALATLAAGSNKRKLPPKAAPEALELLEKIRSKKKLPTQKLQTSIGDLMEVRPAASNAWVVGSKLSASGMPILHNDMHLTHSLPGLIFLQHLKMPGLNITGATMPGLPFMISGFNGKVAWGVTSAVADVVDLVIEKPGDKDCPLIEEKHVIKIKEERSKTFAMRRSCNGPILNDMYPDFLADGAPLVSIRYQIPKVQESFGHLLDANASKSVYELREALMKVPSPIQNIMAADTSGNIAFFSTGSVPKRAEHRGLFPVPGWMEKYKWKGWMAPEEMPHAINPAQGWLANANNLARDPHDQAPLFHLDAGPSYRFERIKEALLALPSMDQSSLQEIQKDNLLERAKHILPALLRDLEGQDITGLRASALEKLRSWNYQATQDSAASSLFMALYRHATQSALEKRLSPGTIHAFLKQRYSTNAVDVWMKDENHPVWDDPNTEARETRKEHIRSAFKKALAELSNKLGDDVSNWKWGSLHYHRPTHPFGNKTVLGFFNLDKHAMAGGLDSVWKAHFNLTDRGEAYKVVAGPVYRFSIDLAHPEKAGFSSDTGASGWPLDPHYSDQYKKWKKGELIPIDRDFAKIKAGHMSTTLELIP